MFGLMRAFLARCFTRLTHNHNKHSGTNAETPRTRVDSASAGVEWDGFDGRITRTPNSLTLQCSTLSQTCSMQCPNCMRMPFALRSHSCNRTVNVPQAAASKRSRLAR